MSKCLYGTASNNIHTGWVRDVIWKASAGRVSQHDNGFGSQRHSSSHRPFSSGLPLLYGMALLDLSAAKHQVFHSTEIQSDDGD